MNTIQKTTTIFLVVLLILAGGRIHAQTENHLILKKGYKSLHHYLVGDEIRFFHSKADNPVIGIIEGIGESFLVLDDKEFPLTEIEKVVYIRKNFNFRAGGKMLQTAAPAFLGISAINALIHTIRPIWSRSNLISAAVIFSTGLILPIFQQKDYELGTKYHLRIVPSDPELYHTEN